MQKNEKSVNLKKLTARSSRAGSSRFWMWRLELVYLALMLARLSVSRGKEMAPREGRPCFFPSPVTMISSGMRSWELGSASCPWVFLNPASYSFLRSAVDLVYEEEGVAGSYVLALVADASLAMWNALYVLGTGTLL